MPVGLVALTTSPSSRLRHQEILNLGHHKSRRYDYPKDLFRGPTSPSKLVNPYIPKTPLARAPGSRVKLSPVLMPTRGFRTHTGVWQPAHELLVARNLRHLETSRIAMVRYPEHHLQDLVVFQIAPLIPKYLSPLLHLGLKHRATLKNRGVLMSPTTWAKNHLLQPRMDQAFLGYPPRTGHLDYYIRPSIEQVPRGMKESRRDLRR